jgi:hypothetical protein
MNLALSVLLFLPSLTPQSDAPMSRLAGGWTASVSPEQARAARAIVEDLFKHWKEGHATLSLPTLLGPEAVVVGVENFKPPRVWRKSAREWLAEQEQRPPKHLVLDGLQVDVSQGALTVVTAQYTGWGIKGRGVFTLCWSEQRWKLATAVLETRLNW